MKSLIAVLALTLTANAFAYSIAETGVSISYSHFSLLKTEAAMVVNDVQELIQNGTATPLLSSKIAQLQDADNSLSDADALDILIEQSNAILAK